MYNGERRAATTLQLVKELLQLIIIPIMGWILWQAIDTQKEIVALRYQVAQVQKDITYHTAESLKDSTAVGALHHRTNIMPCNGCHANGVK